MVEDIVDKAELHEALLHSLTTPMVAVDRSGTVVEWNHAAEECTGITREHALGSAVWSLQARVAPAEIPYEEALQRSHDQFEALVAMSDGEQDDWKREFESDILSTEGQVCHIHTEIFPLRLHHHLYIVGIISRERSSLSEKPFQTIASGC